MVSAQWMYLLNGSMFLDGGNTTQLGEGEGGQERFSGDVTSAGNSWLQDSLSPGGLQWCPSAAACLWKGG